MTPDQPKPLIDFSQAKEPPHSLNLDQDKEAAPLEPEEVSGEIEQDPIRNAFNRQEESAEDVGHTANIPGASGISLEL